MTIISVWNTLVMRRKHDHGRWFSIRVTVVGRVSAEGRWYLDRHEIHRVRDDSAVARTSVLDFIHRLAEDTVLVLVQQLL